MRTVQFKISGMHCVSCAMNIDGELEDTNGVIEAITQYAKGITKVTFDESTTSDEDIIKIIDKVGYTAVPEGNASKKN